MQGRAHKKWVKTIPRSEMVYPERIDEKLKYAFWRAFTPVHPFFRELCMPVRRIRGRAERQHYLLGTIAPEHTLEKLVEHLIKLGYKRHHVAWRDPDELISLRRLENFHWQYHLRIFKDGEVRGHYEHTPESFPLKHLKKINQEDRREEFLEQLEGWIVPEPLRT